MTSNISSESSEFNEEEKISNIRRRMIERISSILEAKLAPQCGNIEGWAS